MIFQYYIMDIMERRTGGRQIRQRNANTAHHQFIAGQKKDDIRTKLQINNLFTAIVLKSSC